MSDKWRVVSGKWVWRLASTLALPVLMLVQAQTYLPRQMLDSTSYGRGVIQFDTAAQTRAYLGISGTNGAGGTNNTFRNDQFTFDGDANVTIKPGALQTNVVLKGDTTVIPEGTEVRLESLLTGMIKDVRIFGVNGDGATDYTATLNTAISNRVNPGETIGFLYGTTIVDGLAINKDINIYIAPGARVKWKDSATAAMITMGVDWSGRIWGGGTIDGGTQTTNAWQYNGLINVRGNNGRIEDITFTNSVRAAIYDVSSRGNLEVTRNRFFVGMQLPTNALFANAFAIFAAGVANTTPHYRFYGNILSNATLSAGYRWCGGVYSAASDVTASLNSSLIADNYFYNVGDDTVSSGRHDGIAAIDLYEENRNVIVRGNHIYRTRYIGIKAQNTQNILIEGNFVYDADSTVGILYASGERFQTNAYNSAIIRNNFVRGNGASTYGVWLGPGDSGTNVMNVLVEGNIITNCYRAVNINGFNTAGPITAFNAQIRNNYLAVTNNNAIMVYGTGTNTGNQLDISGNKILVQGTAGGGISIVQTNSGLNLRIVGNDVVGFGYGGVLRGVRSAFVDNNSWSSANGDDAFEITQDADGNTVAQFVWTRSNRILNGTKDHNLANIVTAVIENEDGTVIRKTSGTTDHQVLMENGTTPIMSINTGSGLMSIGPNTSYIADIPLVVRWDTNQASTLISARNETAAGAANIGVAANDQSGYLGSWSTTFAGSGAARRAGRTAVGANNGSGGLLEATQSGQTWDIYAGSTAMGAQFAEANLLMAGGVYGDLIATNATAGRAAVLDGNKKVISSSVTTNQLHMLNDLATSSTVETRLAAVEAKVAGHAVKEEGTPLTQRAGLNFVGGAATATDDAGNNETDVTITRTGVRRQLWIPASDSKPISTAAAAVYTPGTTTDGFTYDVIDLDGGGTESYTFGLQLPMTWTGGALQVSPRFVVSSGSAGVNIRFRGEAGAVSLGDTFGNVLGASASEATANYGISATDQLGRILLAVTPAGSPAAGDFVVIKVSRLGGDAADTHTTDVRVLGTWVEWTESSTEPATIP